MPMSSRLYSGVTFYHTKDQDNDFVFFFIYLLYCSSICIVRRKTVINFVQTSILQLITECWDDVALNRPSFDHIKKTLHRINPHKMSPVDLMMNMVVFWSLRIFGFFSQSSLEIT